MNFGEKLKDLRTQKGWSQEELAKQMGVTRRTIGGYEAGTTYPRTRDMYAKLAELLETDVNYLMTENEEFMTGNDTLLLVGKVRINGYVPDTIHNRSEATQTIRIE